MTEKLSASEIWHGTIAVVQRHLTSFAMIAGVTVLLPSLLARLLFPQLLDVSAIGNPQMKLPSAYWLWMLLYIVASLIGLFTIAAVAADPDEGGGRTMAAIVRGVFPAIGKGFLAGLVFSAVYALAILVVTIVLGIGMVGVAIITSGGMPDGGNGARMFTIVLGLVLIVVVLPLVTWAGARLSPLTGVYLREPVGVVDGMKRAWALSKGSAWTIIKLLLIVAVLSIAFSAFQLGLARMGFVGGVGGFVVGVVMGGLGALLFVYEAAGVGYLYRRLSDREAA